MNSYAVGSFSTKKQDPGDMLIDLLFLFLLPVRT